MSLTVKKGDNVVVISGKEKSKTGKVLDVSPKTGKVLIENVNIVTKHQKPRSQQDKGGIMKKPAAIDASNVMVLDKKTNKPTRIYSKVDEKTNKKVRVGKSHQKLD